MNKIDCPLILAIDIGRSEINYEDIIFSLEGSPVIEFLINKETHQTIAWLIRSNDSLAFVKPEVKIISAIVAFKCIVDEKSGKIRLDGEIIKNKSALYPLDDETIRLIKRIIFKST